MFVAPTLPSSQRLGSFVNTHVPPLVHFSVHSGPLLGASVEVVGAGAGAGVGAAGASFEQTPGAHGAGLQT